MNKINRKIIAVIFLVIALKSVLSGCVNQPVEKETTTSVSESYGSGQEDTTKAEDKNLETIYEFEKTEFISYTNLGSAIGDEVDLPRNARLSTDAFSAMNGDYTIKLAEHDERFPDGKAIIRGYGYLDADGKPQTVWTTGVKQADLNLSYNEKGSENLAYALSSTKSDEIVGWMNANGLILVQDVSYLSRNDHASSEWKLVDIHQVEHFSDSEDSALIPGEIYIIQKN